MPGKTPTKNDVTSTFEGVAYRAVHTLALQFTGSATPPNVYLTSFYVGVLPGLPPR